MLPARNTSVVECVKFRGFVGPGKDLADLMNAGNTLPHESGGRLDGCRDAEMPKFRNTVLPRCRNAGYRDREMRGTHFMRDKFEISKYSTPFWAIDPRSFLSILPDKY